MIDHVFNHLINALQQSLETSMLEQLPNEEHMLLDLFLGDMHFECSYALPGEVNPSNIRVDITMEWPVWSQSVYRSWLLGESDPESIEVGLELSVRAISLSEPAPLEKILAALDDRSPSSFEVLLERSSIITSNSKLGEDLGDEFEVEIGFDGSIVIEETSLLNPSEIDELLAPLGPWIASLLVRVSDQPLLFFPNSPT